MGVRSLLGSKGSLAMLSRSVGSKQKALAVGQSSELMNRLITARGYTDYLEIGVQFGKTFLDVAAKTKDGVDPNFRFDTTSHANDANRFFEMTSDDFFLSDKVREYDLIFIDGWHSFHQAYRDFCNALLVCRPRGAIVIDDSVPGDVFSALPTQDMAIEARQLHGLGDGPFSHAWMGDVYKVVLAIHDFHPTLDFATLRDPANPFHKPQTLVWRGRRDTFEPIFGDFERIARTSYFELPSLELAFHFAAPEEGIARLEAADQQ